MAMNIIHPGRILQGPDLSFAKQSGDEKQELKSQNKHNGNEETEMESRAI